MEEIVKYNEETHQLEVAKEIINQIINFETLKAEMDLKEKELKAEILNAMKEHNISHWETNDGSIKATYKASYPKTIIDSKRLKEELPDIAEEYSKTSQVSESVTLTINV